MPTFEVFRYKRVRWYFLLLARFSLFVSFLFMLQFAISQKTSNLGHIGTQNITPDITANPTTGINATLQQWSSTLDNSLTAILPINHHALSLLGELLSPFFKAPKNLQEIVIICPENLTLRVRGALHNTVSFSVDHPDISLHTVQGSLNPQSGVLDAASRVSTNWVLLMDYQGLSQQSDSIRQILLHPSSTLIPIGPRGVIAPPLNISCFPSMDCSEKASYLVPPFIMPSLFARNGLFEKSDIWAGLGRRVSDCNSDKVGGLIIGTRDYNTGRWPTLSTTQASLDPPNILPWISSLIDDNTSDSYALRSQGTDSGVFAILLPAFRDLQILGPLMCSLRKSGHRVNLIVYHDSNGPSDVAGREERTYLSDECYLSYTIIFGPHISPRTSQLHSLVSDWLNTLGVLPDILIGPSHEDIIDRAFMTNPKALQDVTVVRIPKEDFPYCLWMGSLSLSEWRGWKTPRVDISIITKDRPQSLSRLLRSLSNSKYFGDILNVRVHLEQSADMETMKIVEGFSWPHGSIFVHHRVIHGGLLAAVVESWYPTSNNTYGLLLEDDVELSPLFYAWIKMSLLRYRHGDLNNRSARMFGISLYQQKSLELSLDGRRAFNARTLFSNLNLPDPNIPYLSPVPCSWGAVYFPEHWREFHTYLSFRLSEHSMKLTQVIVPDVRSNRWKRSWKKYFIELVYLRGYVMLYPNYEDFWSFSTNHLEVGSHVKIRTKEKQDLFALPLMQLPGPIFLQKPSLLDLPSRALPRWDALPVLNLTGSLTTLKALVDVGALRRTELTGCVYSSTAYNVRDLMCISGGSP